MNMRIRSQREKQVLLVRLKAERKKNMVLSRKLELAATQLASVLRVLDR